MGTTRTTSIIILLSILTGTTVSVNSREAVIIDKEEWGTERPHCLNFGQWRSKKFTLNERFDGIEFSEEENNHLKLVPVVESGLPRKLEIYTDSKEEQHYVLEDLFKDSWLERKARNYDKIVTVDGKMLIVHLKKPEQTNENNSDIKPANKPDNQPVNKP
jgi:hypothetical protein